MIEGLVYLLVFQLAGQLIHINWLTNIPGPLIGMLLLFICLTLIPHLQTTISKLTDVIFKHLMLIYIVFGVGLMNEMEVLKQNGMIILLLVVMAAFMTIMITALLGKGIKS